MACTTEKTYEPGKGPWRYRVSYDNSYHKDLTFRRYRAGDKESAERTAELLKQHVGPARVEEYGKRAN